MEDFLTLEEHATEVDERIADGHEPGPEPERPTWVRLIELKQELDQASAGVAKLSAKIQECVPAEFQVGGSMFDWLERWAKAWAER